MNDEQKLEDLRRRLERENEILNATRNIRKIQESEAAKASSDITIEETQQRIDYFQNEMNKLLSRMLDGPGPGPMNAPMNAPMNTGGSGQSIQSSHSRQPSNSSFNPGSSDDPSLNRPLSTVDLLKTSRTITTNKVVYKMHELAYKLEVEKKLKLASEKLEQLGMNAKDGNEESSEKVVLLKRALQKYQGLYIPSQNDDTMESPGMALRRPMTGILHVRIAGIKHQSNAPTRDSRPAESMAVIKIDGALKGKTRMARNGTMGIRWNEDFDIPVRKASEIEITVYDRPDHTAVPIGMFWLKISDLVEELRRRKVEADNDAARAAGDVHDLAVKSPGSRHRSISFGEPASNAVDGVDAWWDLEPAGQIGIKFSFVKDVAVRKRPSKLGRQGAVRKRKGDVQEVQGHKFMSQKFYQIMMCALCNELFTGKGSQCEDCAFTCHTKCAEKVFIKCISSSTAEDPDEAKLNHRIPHRFETFTNLSPNWCYHCGHMLTFGRRHKMCTECPVFAHDGCSDLVPNHCGMPAETANKLMEEIRRRNQSSRHQRASPDIKRSPQQTPSAATEAQSPDVEQERLQQQMEQMKLQQQQEQEDQRLAEEKRQHQQQQKAQMLQQQQAYQQQLQHQQQESEHAYKQEQTAVQTSRPDAIRDVDPFRREQQRLELLRLEQERTQQYQQQHQQQQQQQQRPFPVMPKPHMPTLKIVNKQSAQTQPSRKYGLNDFHFLAVLGRGNFGKVMLAEDKKGGELYAVKALKKDSIVQHDEVESAKSEKRIFQVANKERHPFLTTLHSCFQTNTRLYFVMEYVRGGDLMMHIQRDRRFGERRAKFYGCEVLLALQYFHQNDIVYRDLKLDNILLTLDGHVKIADYGLCKENMPHGTTTRTICGTPEFMAPEIIEEQPYDRSIDWWTFGVLMYEMLLGRAPFSGEEEDDIYDSIMDDEPIFPQGFGRNEQALLQSLLMKVPHLRLGAGPGDAEEIKAHAYFRDVNFDDVYHKRIPPPFLPKVTSAKDVSNFDPEFTRESPSETPSDYQLNHVEQGFFQGFSYVSPWIQP
ncbi:kinase-like domain-containing protein [Gamsiella multidivaricata]|uniref:kinase-like domain-containing protein n=1 Tax=Gamsiella multidivaricata TaxID=101098 RepID=UPI00221E7A10|nr:kinase-like domain-containing protein [Gamsiella multidivaricata]KAG0362280.1 Serine/threonine kinase [Gamsiella multidivaricata]KAI7831140.1 kinase-like domain-containing protein [Gamsiella multidivaricata]